MLTWVATNRASPSPKVRLPRRWALKGFRWSRGITGTPAFVRVRNRSGGHAFHAKCYTA